MSRNFLGAPMPGSRREFMKRGAALLGAMATPGCPARAPRPNIILILADDMGFGDIGIQGAPDISTPNIDRLGIDGIQFLRAYSGGCICAPSRGALSSGRYAAMCGHYYNPPDNVVPPDWGLPHTMENMGEFFKAEGYGTGYIGKWHQGLDPLQHPNVRGFDYFAGSTGRPRRLIQPFGGQPLHYQTQINGVIVTERAYVTEFYADEAVEFVRRNASTPFFLQWSDFAPHLPHIEYDDWIDVPQEYMDRVAHIADPARRGYAATITALDDGVGRLLNELESLGILNNTLIVFTSDNGGITPFSSNGPFREGKNSAYEGGLRVPMLWHWPDRIPSPEILSVPIHHIDLWPTFGSLVSPEHVQRTTAIDGTDLSPYVFWRWRGAEPHERLFFSRTPNQGVIWEGAWKLILKREPDTLELYNLDDDPAESRDLALRFPGIVEPLRATLDDWMATRSPPQWAPSKRETSDIEERLG